MALEDTALRLIEKFGEGRTVTLLQPSTESALSVPGVVVPIRRSLVDGDSILQGDETVLIAGLSLGTTVPTPEDKILDEGVEKNILAVDRVRPGKTDFLWKLQVRAP